MTIKGSIIRSINLSYFSFSVPITLLLLFTVHHLTGGEITPKAVFTALSFITLVQFTIFQAMASAVVNATEGFVAVKRIQVSPNFVQASHHVNRTHRHVTFVQKLLLLDDLYDPAQQNRLINNSRV